MTVGADTFAGRTAAVTGGAGGIGRALAEGLAGAGARTWVLDRDTEALDALSQGVQDVHALHADFAAEPGQEIAARLLDHAQAPIDVIVNNVGITTEDSAMHVAPPAWEEVLRINLTAPFFFTQALAQRLLSERRRGDVLFVSSLHARWARRAPHYSASKAGLEMAARELARDLAPHGIRVNIVRPGWIHTSGSPPQGPDELIPVRRRGWPEDMVGPALALLDPHQTGYVTGAVLTVDGGLDLHSWW